MPARRELLAVAITTAGLAGCVSAVGESTPPPSYRLGPFVLWNRDDRDHEIRLSIHGAGGTEVFDGTRTLEPDESTDVQIDPLPVGEYRFVARVDGSEATAEYTVDECTPDEYFQVLVEADGSPSFRTRRMTSDPPRC